MNQIRSRQGESPAGGACALSGSLHFGQGKKKKKKKTRQEVPELFFLNLKDSFISCSVVVGLNFVIIIQLDCNISVVTYTVTEQKRDMVETLHGSV